MAKLVCLPLVEHMVSMTALSQEEPFNVHLAYARDDNLLFGERIYAPHAQLWLFKPLADVVVTAARLCAGRSDARFVLYDGLRTVDAQAAMLKTRRVKDNPHWLGDLGLGDPAQGKSPLLSRPGTGGHPRGMAIDIGLAGADGTLLDMGCPFDYLADDPAPEHNPAHRDYQGLSDEVRKNRALLDGCMAEASAKQLLTVEPLAQEWWDFRLPRSFYKDFPPLSEADLPAYMRTMPFTDSSLVRLPNSHLNM